MPFTSNLTRIMEGKKITYEELQYLSKVAPDTVAKARTSNIETCKLKTLEKLAKALDVDVKELFDWNG